MSVFGILNRAYHNNKQAIPYDNGAGLDPIGKYVPTAYQGTAQVTDIYRYGSDVQGGRLRMVVLDRAPMDQGPGANDTFYLYSAATADVDGEFVVWQLEDSDATKWLYLDNTNPPKATVGTDHWEPDDAWVYFAPTSKGDIYVDPLRVISHPSFRQVEGEGIYTYPFNPDITRNFAYHPTTKVDGVLQRTLSSNVFVAQPQYEEDIIITEIWLGGGARLSTLAEMFRTLYQYWVTIPDVGESLGWEPRDRTSDRFLVQIVRIQLGGLDFEYQEVRQHAQTNQNAYLNKQLTLQMKLSKRTTPPIGQITLEGR